MLRSSIRCPILFRQLSITFVVTALRLFGLFFGLFLRFARHWGRVFDLLRFDLPIFLGSNLLCKFLAFSLYRLGRLDDGCVLDLGQDINLGWVYGFRALGL